MPPSDDTAARVPLGPVGRYVIANLKQLRDARRLTYRELADRLAELGRPIPTLGLSRIEKGTRRVDADDLVALAIALGVNPSALLLPRDTGPGDEIKLAENFPVAAVAAWEWSAGRYPLVPPDITWQRIADFEAHARPEWYGHSVAEWREEVARRDAEMAELKRKAEAAEQQLRVERARNGHSQPDQLQPVVAAIVTSDRGVLVGRRNDGTPPWTFIAGEQEPGERPEDTAVREVKEETALRIQVGEIIGERVHPATGRTMVYLAARPTHGTDVVVNDEAELAEVRWVGLAEADALLPGMFGRVREHLARELGEA